MGPQEIETCPATPKNILLVFSEASVSIYTEEEPSVEPGTLQVLILSKRSLVNIFDDSSIAAKTKPI